MFYVLVMNTVKLCIREKNEKQMLPFSEVVYRMPLSELKGVTLCEQETQPTIILSSLHFTPSFTHAAILCLTTNLCQDCIQRTEKTRNQSDLLHKTICKTLIKSH